MIKESNAETKAFLFEYLLIRGQKPKRHHRIKKCQQTFNSGPENEKLHAEIYHKLKENGSQSAGLMLIENGGEDRLRIQ